MNDEVRKKLAENAAAFYEGMRVSEVCESLPTTHLKNLAICSVEGYLEDAISELNCEEYDVEAVAKSVQKALNLIKLYHQSSGD